MLRCICMIMHIVVYVNYVSEGWASSHWAGVFNLGECTLHLNKKEKYLDYKIRGSNKMLNTFQLSACSRCSTLIILYYIFFLIYFFFLISFFNILIPFSCIIWMCRSVILWQVEARDRMMSSTLNITCYWTLSINWSRNGLKSTPTLPLPRQPVPQSAKEGGRRARFLLLSSCYIENNT